MSAEQQSHKSLPSPSGGTDADAAKGVAPLAAHHEGLADRARAYVEAPSSANTRRTYAADRKHFAA
jgi:hypothetical protein